ncbi:MAG: DUF502 domain-containing protein [Hyphomicrobiales bacterium]|nr:DUF502 domain-containing protein [Hyphomicrobiales bacterium]
MVEFLSRFWRNSVIGTFFAGALFLLPVVVTFVIITWIVNLVRGQLGPDTFLGDLLTRLGIVIIGPEQNTYAFWLGLVIALIGIWFLGAIVKSQAKSIAQDAIDRIFARVPLIRSIYSPVARVVRLATNRDGGAGDFSGMTVVSCRFFGDEHGVDILALLASQEVYLMGGERRRLVYLPAAPIPMSGGLVFMPESDVFPVPDMKVDDLLKVYVSLGALAPETMPAGLIARRGEQPVMYAGAPAAVAPPAGHGSGAGGAPTQGA